MKVNKWFSSVTSTSSHQTGHLTPASNSKHHLIGKRTLSLPVIRSESLPLQRSISSQGSL